MSDGPIRLRLGKDASAPPSLPVREGDARAALGTPSIAVVAAVRAGDADAFAAQLEEAARAAGMRAVTWRASLREREGAETSGGAVRASADAIAEAVDALVATAGDVGTDTLRIAVGLPFVALRRADVSILLTGGASAVYWDPELRALRDRFELAVAEPRAGLARALIERLSGPAR